MEVNGLEMLQKNIQPPKKVQNNTHIEKMLGLKMNGKNLIIFNGLEMHHRNTLSLKRAKMNIHIEKMPGQKVNNNKQMISSG